MSDKPSHHLPDVPTIHKLGHPKLASLGVPWTVVAPPGTPEDRLELLRGVLRKVIQRDEFMKWGRDNGYEPDTMPPKEFWRSMEDMREIYLSLKSQMKQD
jgi:tripartite-type tricarboxylate transporter receptor subunit TctC